MLLLYQDEEQLGISILEHQNEDCIYKMWSQLAYETQIMCVFMFMCLSVCVLVLHYQLYNYTKQELSCSKLLLDLECSAS